MSEDPNKSSSPPASPSSEELRSKEDAELEREVRSKRKFSLAEAIGRAGADLLKGTSPVTLKRQAELAIEQHLESELEDPEGALQLVLLRQVRESEGLLEDGYEDPLAALARICSRILQSESRLLRFVTSIDAEWGRIYSERPYFERKGSTPHRKDPYTVASVKLSLEALVAKLKRADEER